MFNNFQLATMFNHDDNKKGDGLYDSSPVRISKKTYLYPLLYNPQMVILPPCPGETYCTNFNMIYFHTGCDGVDDSGWGEGYRTLQSVCSSVLSKLRLSLPVPSIREIQEILIACQCAEPQHAGSQDWIGALDAFFLLRTTYKIHCKYVHVTNGQLLYGYINSLKQYFKDYGGFIYMDAGFGGNSTGIAGIHVTNDDAFLLIVNPNFEGTANSFYPIIKSNFIKWVSIKALQGCYNLCMPKFSKHTERNLESTLSY